MLQAKQAFLELYPCLILLKSLKYVFYWRHHSILPLDENYLSVPPLKPSSSYFFKILNPSFIGSWPPENLSRHHPRGENTMLCGVRDILPPHTYISVWGLSVCGAGSCRSMRTGRLDTFISHKVCVFIFQRNQSVDIENLSFFSFRKFEGHCLLKKFGGHCLPKKGKSNIKVPFKPFALSLKEIAGDLANVSIVKRLCEA